MEKHYFIQQVASAIHENNCELFIGSGISCAAKLPNWKQLLEPVAKAYGYDISAFEDLPLLAQYILNENSGNRNVLTKLISDNFDVHNIKTYLHTVISNMNVTRYWTTNYDPLLEEALGEHASVAVITKDSDLKRIIHGKSQVVIKLHGSYNELDSVILTRNDYDNYFYTHTLIQEMFSSSLTSKSILFIGYSYNDPDIRMIMAHAQTKLDGTQNHYIITKKPEKTLDGDMKIFDGWIKEMQRMGMHVLCIDDYDELPSILNDISMLSRGRSVFVTGSHKSGKDIKYKEVIVKKILEMEGILINGQSEGIGLSFLNSFCELAFEKKKDISKHLQLYINPYSIDSRFSDDKTLIPELKRLRYDLIKHTQLMILYPGGMGTKAEEELAIEQGTCILPIIDSLETYDNEAIRFFMESEEALDTLSRYAPDYKEILLSKGIPTEEDILASIEKILKG